MHITVTIMEPIAGIEPTFSDYEADVLPLNYTGKL